MEEATDDYRRRTDTVVGFVDECCELDPEARERTSTVYTAYQQWCRNGGRQSLGRGRVIEHVSDVFPQVEYKPRYGGHPTWIGLRLRYAERPTGGASW
jgi:phage/plasmid-associated DNA primase